MGYGYATENPFWKACLRRVPSFTVARGCPDNTWWHYTPLAEAVAPDGQSLFLVRDDETSQARVLKPSGIDPAVVPIPYGTAGRIGLTAHANGSWSAIWIEGLGLGWTWKGMSSGGSTQTLPGEATNDARAFCAVGNATLWVAREGGPVSYVLRVHRSLFDAAPIPLNVPGVNANDVRRVECATQGNGLLLALGHDSGSTSKVTLVKLDANGAIVSQPVTPTLPASGMCLRKMGVNGTHASIVGNPASAFGTCDVDKAWLLASTDSGGSWTRAVRIGDNAPGLSVPLDTFFLARIVDEGTTLGNGRWGALVRSDNSTNSTGLALISWGAEAIPVLDVDPAALDFGSLVVGRRSEMRSIRVSNTGYAPLAISDVALAGTEAGAFSLSNDCTGRSLQAGQACEIVATFGPTTAGYQRASIRIASNDPATPHTISLSGRAEPADLDPTPPTASSKAVVLVSGFDAAPTDFHFADEPGEPRSCETGSWGTIIEKRGSWLDEAAAAAGLSDWANARLVVAPATQRTSELDSALGRPCNVRLRTLDAASGKGRIVSNTDLQVHENGVRLWSFLNYLGTEHGVREVVLVGHSMGGLLSMWVAGHKRDETPKVRGVITLDTPHIGSYGADIAADASLLEGVLAAASCLPPMLRVRDCINGVSELVAAVRRDMDAKPALRSLTWDETHRQIKDRPPLNAAVGLVGGVCIVWCGDPMLTLGSVAGFGAESLSWRKSGGAGYFWPNDGIVGIDSQRATDDDTSPGKDLGSGLRVFDGLRWATGTNFWSHSQVFTDLTTIDALRSLVPGAVVSSGASTNARTPREGNPRELERTPGVTAVANNRRSRGRKAIKIILTTPRVARPGARLSAATTPSLIAKGPFAVKCAQGVQVPSTPLFNTSLHVAAIPVACKTPSLVGQMALGFSSPMDARKAATARIKGRALRVSVAPRLGGTLTASLRIGKRVFRLRCKKSSCSGPYRKGAELRISLKTRALPLVGSAFI